MTIQGYPAVIWIMKAIPESKIQGINCSGTFSSQKGRNKRIAFPLNKTVAFHSEEVTSSTFRSALEFESPQLTTIYLKNQQQIIP